MENSKEVMAFFCPLPGRPAPYQAAVGGKRKSKTGGIPCIELLLP